MYASSVLISVANNAVIISDVKDHIKKLFVVMILQREWWKFFENQIQYE